MYINFRTAVIAVFIVLAPLCLSACEGRAADHHIIIAGSTSVQPYAEILAEEFTHIYPDSEIDIQGGGSSAGIAAAESGTAAIGMSSRHLTEKEAHMQAIEIAKDGLALIIHPSNPIDSLSLEQVRKIYTSDITDWSELGGRKAKIHLISREEGSGTRSAFEELVMAKTPITPRAIIQDSNGAVRLLVSADANALGFISLGLLDETVKALKLDGVEPTGDNIENGSYSLYRPFLYVLHDEPEGLAKVFIDYSLSPGGLKILMDEGLVAPTERALKQ